MRIDVTEFEKQYTFTLERVTQLCGMNVAKKAYVLESLRRYFGTYKYQEKKNKWRDNIKVDGETVGRKYFSVLSVKDASDLLLMIKLSKQSLMMEYVKQLMQKFDWQIHLRAIHAELDEMYQLLNTDVRQLGDLELAYDMSEVWDLIQKSNVVWSGSDSVELEDTDHRELVAIFLHLIEEIQKSAPRKMLIIIENLDHMISRREYGDVIRKMQSIGMRYDVYFIVSTSIDGYVMIDRELCAGITVFGEVDFQMPEMEEMLQYINEHYPLYKQFSEDEIQELLTKIVHRIGQEKYLHSIEENIICKMINQTLMLSDRWSDEKIECAPEFAFLRS